jgi:hypothetical protein
MCNGQLYLREELGMGCGKVFLCVTLFLPALNKFLLLVKPLLKFDTGLDNLSEILVAGYWLLVD